MRLIYWLAGIMIFAYVFCLAMLTSAHGQVLRGDALGLRPAALPVRCNIGDLRVDSADSYRLKLCNATNTWSVASFADPMTTDGDLITQAAGIPARLGIGSTSHVLQVSGAAPTWGLITDGNVDAAAGIVDTKLATISTAGKVSNSATTATALNTNSAIVARDGSGNFAAGTVTAALSGNATTATALAVNPSPCSAGQYVSDIAADGTLTCSAVGFTQLSGTAATTQGGTGLTSYSTGDVLYASGSNTLAKLGIGSTSQVLTVVGGVPTWQAATVLPTVFYVKAEILSSGSVTSLGTSAISSDTEIADSTLTMTPASGSNAVGVMCSGTNNATSPSTSPTTCAAGNEVFGGSFAVASGDEVYPFEVCLDFSWRGEVDQGETLDLMFVLAETATNSTTILQEGARLDALIQAGSTAGNSSISDHPFRLCGLFKFATSGTKGFRLFVQQFIGGSPNASYILADGAFAGRNVTFTAKRLN